MTEAIAFDTHLFVKRLTGGGFSEQQAETLAQEQVAFFNTSLATKADTQKTHEKIEVSRQETKADIQKVHERIEASRQETKVEIEKVHARIESLRETTKIEIETLRKTTKTEIEKTHEKIEAARQKTKAEIERTKAELLKWMFAGLIAQGGLIVTLVKVL